MTSLTATCIADPTVPRNNLPSPACHATPYDVKHRLTVTHNALPANVSSDNRSNRHVKVRIQTDNELL